MQAKNSELRSHVHKLYPFRYNSYKLFCVAVIKNIAYTIKLMKLYKYQVVTVLLAGLLMATGPASAVLLGGDDPDVIWKSGAIQVIKYEKQDDARFGKNSHPVDLDAKTINTALKAVFIPDRGLFTKESDEISLFTFEIMKTLADNLSKGLKKARPDQDIIFILGKSHRTLVFITKKEYMAGRAFYKDGKLNIIVGNYALPRNDALESLYDPSGRGDVPYVFNFGSRTTASSELKDYVVRVEGVENKVIANKVRKDWFVIDVNVAAATAANKSNKGNKNQDRSLDSEAIRQESEQLARERRQMRLEMAKMRKEMQEGKEEGANNEKSQLTTEERLGQLEELHKKKLISEDEYNQKRKEILDDI